MSKFAKGINLKNAKAITKLIYSLPSISCPDLELLAVTIFEISSFLCKKLERAITKKKFFFLF